MTATKPGDNYLLWSTQRNLEIISFICGSCGRQVASGKGYDGTEYSTVTNSPTSRRVYVRICPHCSSQIYLNVDESQTSDLGSGKPIRGASYPSVEKLYKLYNEACRCVSANAFTACALCCQKILMNIALSKGAKKESKFVDCVTFLSEKGYIPPDGRRWVDHIREKWDEPPLHIDIVKRKDAEALLNFTEVILKYIFDFPSGVQEVL